MTWKIFYIGNVSTCTAIKFNLYFTFYHVHQINRLKNDIFQHRFDLQGKQVHNLHKLFSEDRKLPKQFLQCQTWRHFILRLYRLRFILLDISPRVSIFIGLALLEDCDLHIATALLPVSPAQSISFSTHNPRFLYCNC